MTIFKALFAPSCLTAFCLLSLPTEAITRSSSYLPNNNFCAVYQGKISNEHQFVLWVNQEDKLTVQANKYLTVAVSQEGNVVTPYLVDSVKKPMTSQWFYHPKVQQKHIISVKGNTSTAKIRLCLHQK